MISFNNGVTNILGTPGIITDDYANLPAASSVAVGTIFIYTFDGDQYMKQSDGTTWLNFGGGGGSTPGIDSVLAVDQALSANGRNINVNGHDFQIYDGNSPSSQQFFISGFDMVVGSTVVGDIRFTNGIIKTEYNGIQKGLNLDFDAAYYTFGEETYFINVNVVDSIIRSYTDSSKFGFEIAKDYMNLGDYAGVSNNTHIEISDPDEYILLLANVEVALGIGNVTKVSLRGSEINFDGAALQSSSAGGNSGKHLNITLNGTSYKIPLLNP